MALYRATAPYIVALGAIVAAVAVRLILEPLLHDAFPFATVFLAIMVAAWYGGFRPALAATVVGGVVSLFFLIPPYFSFVLKSSTEVTGLVLYSIVGVGISFLGGVMHDARLRAQNKRRLLALQKEELEREVQQRTAAERQLRQSQDELIQQSERLQVTLGSIGDAVIATDAEGRLTFINTIAEQLTGWSLADAIARPLTEVFQIVNQETGSSVENPVEKALREGRIVGLANHTVLISRQNQRIPIDDSAAPIRNARGELIGVILVFRDIGERYRAEQRRNARMAVTQVLAHPGDVADTIPKIIKILCDSLGYEVGTYWEVDEDKVLIEPRFFHPQEDGNNELFRSATSSITLRLGEGLPGRVWCDAEPCWVCDVFRDLNFTRATAALNSGLHGAFAFPVHVGEHVLGVMEFFSCEIRHPDEDLLEMMATLGNQLGHFLERHSTGESLRRSERELADFFENASIGLHWVGPSGLIERVNRAELEMLGYERDEYLGHHIEDFHVDADVISDILLRLQAGETLHDYPAQMRCKDGSVVDVLIDSSVMWAEGRFVHSRCFTRDVTQKKRSEDTLRFLADASVALSSLVDTTSTLQNVANLAVPRFADWCTIDMLDESRELQRVAVAHVNPAKVMLAHELHRRYGHDRSATTGPWTILRSGTSELIPEISEEILESSLTAELLPVLRELGLRSYMGVPIQFRGESIGVMMFIAAESGRHYTIDDVKIAQDLASRIAIALDNARLYEEVREAGARKDEFLATLAHELRNPLAPMRNGLEVLSLSPGDEEAVEEARGIMQRQLDQMVRLVDDLLDISRITRGKLELRRQRTSLETVINTAVETSLPVVEASRHDLHVELPSQPIELEADTTRLAQVFANLLNNSAKYTPPGGKIVITAEPQDDHVIVAVRDDGIGISREMLPKIFEMFTQVDRAIERAQGGLGIGLTLVRRLVEMHGGTVQARSAGENQGSEFTVRLPILAANESPAKASQSQTSIITPRRILVVDDNRDSAVTLGMMLRLLKHEIRTAYDGLEALKAAEAFRPEVVLLDIGLPKMTGYEVARRIRATTWGTEMLLVALTGWGQDEDRRRSKEAGFDHHFVKPIDIADLKRVLADGVTTAG